MAEDMMIKVVRELRLKHFHNCCCYQKTIMKVIGTLSFPFDVDRYIFTYVGFSYFYVPDYKVGALVALRLKESSP